MLDFQRLIRMCLLVWVYGAGLVSFLGFAFAQTDQKIDKVQPARLECELLLLSVAVEESPNHGQELAKGIEGLRVLTPGALEKLAIPYVSRLRPPETLDPEVLARLAQDLPNLRDVRLSKVILSSPNKSALNGLVQVGFLSDGRPVAVKTIHKGLKIAKDEAKSSKLLSLIGVGPQFHGVFLDTRARLNIVTDLIGGELFVGNFRGRITAKLLNQAGEVFRRLRAINIRGVPASEMVFQVMRSYEDELLIIDADGYLEEFVEGNSWLSMESFEGDGLGLSLTKASRSRRWSNAWHSVLAGYILSAETEIARLFLNELKVADPDFFDDTIYELRDLVLRWNGARDRPDMKELILNPDHLALGGPKSKGSIN